jgi:hypothetical protein
MGHPLPLSLEAAKTFRFCVYGEITAVALRDQWQAERQQRQAAVAERRAAVSTQLAALQAARQQQARDPASAVG